MATEPLRLRVLKALTMALSEITPDNGYHTDVRFTDPEGVVKPAVYRGRMVFGENDPLPILSILEAPIPLDQTPVPRDSEFSSGGWELMVQGFVKDDSENPTDPAHFFMADVKKRLALERRKANAMKNELGILGLGNFITQLRIGTGVVRPPDEISATAYFWLTITLDMVEDLTDPFED